MFQSSNEREQGTKIRKRKLYNLKPKRNYGARVQNTQIVQSVTKHSECRMTLMSFSFAHTVKVGEANITRYTRENQKVKAKYI